MTSIASGQQAASEPDPGIRKLDTGAPMRWLGKGWDDMRARPVASLAYGLVFTIAGILMIWLGPANPIFTLFLLSSFMLIGPLAAVGLYDMSHRIEDGETPSLLHALSNARFSTFKLIMFGLILGMVILLWTVITTAVVNLFFGNSPLVMDSLGALMNGQNSLPFFAIFILSGLVLALLASAVAIISVPLASHRRADTITAGIILLVLLVVWARLIAMLFGLFFGNTGLISGGWQTLLGDANFLPFFVTFVSCGFALALVAFSISVVTVQYISHRDVGLMTAISTSIRAVAKNPVVMMRWAAMIAIMMILGMGAFFIGLAVTLPVIGHASWHAYRETVED
ncbi:DUF2189 domain-containing protein [Thiothrix nivea]|uniref:Integral membrane protein n=1 Tax=Thiothrix nivea (strain ATCC 35100 / DSM 5205 / JP2) TaxID=870187 RepID=A0A656HBY8_THINJ|nr:DUF2189 domain-containing protein [Thiothrix nivea]EIJ33504.1 Protein of unknown function DUF2189, transmembrane [Thiothrix nivea DSM 5205]